MEIWDAYDKNGNKLGHDLIRGEAIPFGEYHLVVEVIVKNNSNILSTKRSLEKHFAGLFECTGGSAIKGEDALTAAKREVFEETGISTGEYRSLYTVVSQDSIYSCFICKTTENRIKLQKGETIDYVWVSMHEFPDFIAKDTFVPTQKERFFPYLNKIIEA